MHEVSIVLALYDACRRETTDRGGGRIARVQVAVGELSAVEPDLLHSAWEMVVAGGPDAGSLLQIDWRPAVQRCPACGVIAERQPGSWLRLCPRCALPLLVEGGRELDILTIEYDAVRSATEVPS